MIVATKPKAKYTPQTASEWTTTGWFDFDRTCFIFHVTGFALKTCQKTLCKHESMPITNINNSTRERTPNIKFIDREMCGHVTVFKPFFLTEHCKTDNDNTRSSQYLLMICCSPI